MTHISTNRAHRHTRPVALGASRAACKAQRAKHNLLGVLCCLVLAALMAKIKTTNILPLGSGPESAQNPRALEENDNPDPPRGPPGGGGPRPLVPCPSVSLPCSLAPRGHARPHRPAFWWSKVHPSPRSNSPPTSPAFLVLVVGGPVPRPVRFPPHPAPRFGGLGPRPSPRPFPMGAVTCSMS